MKSSQIAEAYDKYLGPKCSRVTYYNRVKKGINIIEALKPVEKKQRHQKGKINTKRFVAEMERYYKQTGPKVDRQRFYQRLYKGYPQEEAIKINFGLHRSGGPINYKQGYVRQITPIIKYNPDYWEIKIKYSKEEANIIRREYERMIDDLELKRRVVDDPIEAKDITEKIDKLKNEYKTFCLVNYQLP